LVNTKSQENSNYANPGWALNNTDINILRQEYQNSRQQAQTLQKELYGVPGSAKK
jgi:hypothetical protein